jgi:SNF family Na+-dependent transporter
LLSGIISFADVLVGFIAASILLGTIYAVAPSLEYAESAIGAGNVGLTFIYIVELLAAMPGSTVLAPLFFLALSLAGISSLIAMFELTTTNLMNFGLARRRAALMTGGAAFLFGIPSALSITFLDNQDWVWGVGLLVSGLLTALAVLKYGAERARVEGLADRGSVVARHPRDGHGVVADHLHHQGHRLVVGHAVLLVHAHVVHACARDQLRAERARHRRPQPERGPVLLGVGQVE